jgi:beta-lactam-binding protein with PASTA domain
MSRLKPWLEKIGMTGLLLVGLLLLVVLVDRLLLPGWTRLGHEQAAPELVGLDLEAAGLRASSEGFKLVVERQRSDPTGRFGKNQVMEQFPRAGSMTKHGRRIYVGVSTGGRHVIVPDLSGLSLRQATGRLADVELGMDSNSLDYRFDERFGRDAVITHQPAPGDSLLPGESVSLVLSLGRKPETVEVPALLGLSREQARLNLRQAGLAMGETHLLLERGKGAGLLRQNPLPGRSVPPDTPVDIWINQE